MKEENEYIPGKCNIGEAERKLRRRSGYLSIAVACIFLIFLYSVQAAHLVRVFLFLPLFIATISFLQDRFHFCAEFGILGVYNFGEIFNRLSHPNKKEFVEKDRRRALQIILYSIVIALLVTLLVVALP